ncbi:hypothetical protein IAI10_16660 [Clostridium sp. 19966]|uniref:hypothetical protein n=1 Tax=Clostridium sp. 19966 TaxID=2768166 RepID=UPI0028DF9953|nr:hypothetical protein [Clostridium sp. 19966]MDT8718301.1 hypothetical protein [Clostridium sp. 19966]
MVDPYDFYITPEEYDRALLKGISKDLLEVRIRTLAWDKERAINTSPNEHKRLDSDWIKLANQNGICYSTFKYRANELGWDLERAATQPLQDRSKQAQKLKEKNRKYPKKFKELALKNGISERTFHRRLKLGLSIEIAATRPIMTPREVGLLTKEKRQRGF